MAKRPNLGQINSSFFSVGQLNTAFAKIDEAFDNTLSRDGSTPNTMEADLDLNSNSIINADNIGGNSLTVDEATIGGKLFTGTIEWRSDWLTGVVYKKLDLVKKDNSLYICLEQHMSDVFATDLTNGRWEAFVLNVEGPQGPPGDDGAPGAGLTDGDKGDVTVSGSGSTITIDNGVVTLAKMANMATSSLIYRKTAGTGVPEVNTLATLKTDLGLTGTNSGDQTSIVGITGTKAQFDTAVTDGNFMYVGDAPTAHTHVAANITDFNTAVAATPAVTANTAKVTNATHTGDVTGATALTIANDVVSNAKLANMANATIKGRTTAGTGDPEDLTATQVKSLLAIASTDITDFNSAARAQTEAELVAGTNITITASGSGATRQLTIAASGGGGPSAYDYGLTVALNQSAYII